VTRHAYRDPWKASSGICFNARLPSAAAHLEDVLHTDPLRKVDKEVPDGC